MVIPEALSSLQIRFVFSQLYQHTAKQDWLGMKTVKAKMALKSSSKLEKGGAKKFSKKGRHSPSQFTWMLIFQLPRSQALPYASELKWVNIQCSLKHNIIHSDTQGQFQTSF